jgi:CDP-glycerol glycerophosphotransferase
VRDLQVAILAAGMGTRLDRPLPKALTPLQDGRTILARQVDGLRSELGAGVPITVVVGFQASTVMGAAPDLLFAYNPDYRTTNTSKSLLRALTTSRPGGVLWLNGDVVFDPRILRHLLSELRADRTFVCVDTAAVGEEEVKYTLDDAGFVRELSKTVREGLGEAIGINYVSGVDKAVLIEHLRRCGDTDYFERGIETAIEECGLRVRAVDITRFDAVEVDFEEDLQRANRMLGVLEGTPPRDIAWGWQRRRS